MNYRHIFHAGNFGDVFKHALLIPLLRGMQRKEKGFLYVDTHAGIGYYDLNAEETARTNEFAAGIGELWALVPTPSPLRDYIDFVRDFNRTKGGTTDVLRFYPGSPAVAAWLRRPQDRLALSELHPADFQLLKERFDWQRGVSIQKIDAYSALRAHLPPPERRALVLIDPPYEDPNEPARIHQALDESLQRFPGGCYAIWYPVKSRAEADSFPAYFSTLPMPPTLAIELLLNPGHDADRLIGCGLLVLNPPWKIESELDSITAELRRLLASNVDASHRTFWLKEETASNAPSSSDQPRVPR